MTDEDGFRIEAVEQFGFHSDADGLKYTATEDQLIAFAKACERAGMAKAREMAHKCSIRGLVADMDSIIATIDADLAPILKAERERTADETHARLVAAIPDILESVS